MCAFPTTSACCRAVNLTRLDNISNGRVEVGIGMGYALHEFRGFGLPVSRRVSLRDVGLTVLWHAFTGEAFSFEGKRYTVQNVKITPGYGPTRWTAALDSCDGCHANGNILRRFEALGTKVSAMLEIDEAILDGEVIAADRLPRSRQTAAVGRCC